MGGVFILRNPDQVFPESLNPLFLPSVLSLVNWDRNLGVKRQNFGQLLFGRFHINNKINPPAKLSRH
jgi:hypothetical protein